MNLYKITTKKHGYEEYNGFVIAANTIPEALEAMYECACPAKDWIPYNLRSSNLTIENLGEFTPNEKHTNNIIMTSYINA
jgi:hypothetical protein